MLCGNSTRGPVQPIYLPRTTFDAKAIEIDHTTRYKYEPSVLRVQSVGTKLICPLDLWQTNCSDAMCDRPKKCTWPAVNFRVHLLAIAATIGNYELAICDVRKE